MYVLQQRFPLVVLALHLSRLEGGNKGSDTNTEVGFVLDQNCGNLDPILLLLLYVLKEKTCDACARKRASCHKISFSPKIEWYVVICS